MASERKSYEQICPIARALDVVGDRWTPLILRELLGGPARFNELLPGVPGVAKNLLTARLRRLESDGVVARINTGGVVQYALTDLGMAIRPTLEHLGFWGAQVARVAEPRHGRTLRAVAMALQAILVRAPIPAETNALIELDVDAEMLEIELCAAPTVTVRPCPRAHARGRVPHDTFTTYLTEGRLEAAAFTFVSGVREGWDTMMAALAAMSA